MAVAESARLIASLELQDRKFQQGVNRSLTGIGKLEGRLGKLGASARKGASNAATNIAKIGVVAGAGLGLAIKSGIDSLVELENATTSVDGAIKQMGLTGQTTSAQIAQWANEIEASTEAAFDDKAIVAGAGALIRYGKVSGANLRPALEVMTNLAAKTGSVESASSKLAKSLADPTKATRVLREVGVTLTKQQQKQIDTWVKQGKLAKAQAFILQQVGAVTKDAAKNAFGPAADAQHKLDDVIEDSTKLLAEGFLPILTKVSDKLSTALADPATMDSIRNLGHELAGALDSVIDIAGKIPWSQVKDAFAVGGTFAKTLLQTFTSMPAWVQTAVLTGWGLNKLTGGAIGDIAGELGKGLIKGVLGITTPLVKINAAVVQGAGGIPGGGPPVPGGGGSKLATVGKVLGGLLLAGIAVELVDLVRQEIGKGSSEHASEVNALLQKNVNNDNFDAVAALNGVEQGIRDIQSNPLNVLIQGDALDQLKQMREQLKPKAEAQQQQSIVEFRKGERESASTGGGKLVERNIQHMEARLAGLIDKSGASAKAAAAELKGKLADANRHLAELRDPTKRTPEKIEAAKAAQVEAIRTTGSTTGTNIRGTTSAVQTAQGAITAAIQGSKPIVTTLVTVNVTGKSVETSQSTQTNYGQQNPTVKRPANNTQGKGG